MTGRPLELLGLFLAACASLLYEITLTKVFEYSGWSNYAYMVVSTAMFGLGFAGVILIRRPALLEQPRASFLARNAAGMGLAMFLGFLVVNYLPLHLPDAPAGWTQELVNLAVVFLFVSLPFVFFGLMMSYLFEKSGEEANVYYFADLLGAGVGSFLLVPLIPVLEPQGIFLLVTLMGLTAAVLFGIGAFPGRRWILPAAAALILVFAAGAVLEGPRMASRLPLQVHVVKRHYKKALKAGIIEATRWSALSRVDISAFNQRMKKVWIAGGVNESVIKKFDGDFETLRAGREDTLRKAANTVNHSVLPHLSKINHEVCVIGTSGGIDSLLTLECGARKVTGVEMDPAIASLVTEDYKKWAGGLFTDGVHSELVVDEGRSYLRRSGRKFDVIQQVNNFTPIALAKGALNLSENYLLTVESFREFYDHLTPDGILSIHRSAAVRLLSTAVEMFRRMGLKPEEYSRHLVVAGGASSDHTAFMMKRSPFTPEEIDRIYEWYGQRNFTGRIFWAPYREKELPNPENNIYLKIATAADPTPYLTQGPFSFEAPTDNRPFFNHLLRLGMRDDDRGSIPMLPDEFRVRPTNALGHRVPKGDLPPILILFEALLLSTVFFGVPLLGSGALRSQLRGNLRSMGYFACLGVAFIFIEICLIQRLILFLGAPVYSIAVVFGSILVSAGLGSLVSGRLQPRPEVIRKLLWILAAVILVMHFAIPVLTGLFLGTPFAVRVLVSVLITGALGFLMGMPMPTGIRFLTAGSRNATSWAWAVNGYFTVVGSALSILVAVNAGFLAVFFLAAGLYAVAPLFLQSARE